MRALDHVSKGAFVLEYAGEVIDERELSRRMEHARMNGEPHFYIMELSAGEAGGHWEVGGWAGGAAVGGEGRDGRRGASGASARQQST